MKIKLYTRISHYDEIEVETEQEHQGTIQDCFENAMDGFSSDFENYLNDRYTPADIFDMGEEEKDGVEEEFKEWFFEHFDDENNWKVFEKEIED